jgi:phosphoribosylformylglycinamidine cyclo-ligase
MLRPTIIYAPAFLRMRDKKIPWLAAAHITGGGLLENPPRIFENDTFAVELDPKTWEVPPIMKLIASAGVAPMEMRRTFNMGLGMTIVVPEAAASTTVELLQPEGARIVGKIVRRNGGEASRFVGD